MKLSTSTLETLAIAADYMATESWPKDRGGRDASYLRRAADDARAAARAADTNTTEENR